MDYMSNPPALRRGPKRPSVLKERLVEAEHLGQKCSIRHVGRVHRVHPMRLASWDRTLREKDRSLTQTDKAELVAISAADIPGSEMSSSSGGVVAPGGGFVVGLAGFEAAVADADPSVPELAQRGLVADLPVFEGRVVGLRAG